MDKENLAASLAAKQTPGEVERKISEAEDIRPEGRTRADTVLPPPDFGSSTPITSHSIRVDMTT